MEKHLHIISFDIPLPANYGGAIDVYNKLKALSESGVQITLHAFFTHRVKDKTLEALCKKVYYYRRGSFLKSFLSPTPFIVKTRSNALLMKNLSADHDPILFEGLHTTFPLLHNQLLSNRLKMIRMHNIEHRYYGGLAKSESRCLKKMFFYVEAIKLKFYEKIVQKADVLFPISTYETAYYQNKYPEINSVYVPPFHENNAVVNLMDSKGKFALYHGDMRVSDNIKAVRFLLDVFKNIKTELVVAGDIIPSALLEEIKRTKNVRFVELNQSQPLLDKLFAEAHINVLPSFQKTGIKLKLINALYKSRFVVGNSPMLTDTGMENMAVLAQTVEEFREKITALMQQDYTKSDDELKRKTLSSFDVSKNIKKLIDFL